MPGGRAERDIDAWGSRATPMRLASSFPREQPLEVCPCIDCFCHWRSRPWSAACSLPPQPSRSYSGFHLDVWHRCWGGACPPRKTEIAPIRLLGDRSRSTVRISSVTATSCALATCISVVVFSQLLSKCAPCSSTRSCRRLISFLLNPRLYCSLMGSSQNLAILLARSR
jgi:hypothetical protein